MGLPSTCSCNAASLAAASCSRFLLRWWALPAKNITTANMTLTKAAITYAHGIVIASPNANPELVAFARENKRNIVEYNADRTVFYEQINKLYDTIIGSNINN